jgi:hypothetical protein
LLMIASSRGRIRSSTKLSELTTAESQEVMEEGLASMSGLQNSSGRES